MIPRAYITEWTQYAPWKTNERDSPLGEMSARTEGQGKSGKTKVYRLRAQDNGARKLSLVEIYLSL